MFNVKLNFLYKFSTIGSTRKLFIRMAVGLKGEI